MGKDFALNVKELDKVKGIEASILEAEAEFNPPPAAPLDPAHRDNFSIVPGRPLPEGFVNPERGEEGHLCLDQNKCYQPTWSQLKIFKIFDHQQDPQVFPLGSNWLVRLEEWTDVPPEIIESLRSAVEEHHEYNAKPGDIVLGNHPEHKVNKRRRFHWDHIKSA